MDKDELKKIRNIVADLIYSSGCGCCRDDGGWYVAQEKLATLLDVPKYEDGSGYDFNKFRSEDNI